MTFTATFHSLSDLRPGDQITRLGNHTYRKPLTVEAALGPIEPDSPVVGVRCGTLSGGVEMVLYPASVRGLEIEVTF